MKKKNELTKKNEGRLAGQTKKNLRLRAKFQKTVTNQKLPYHFFLTSIIWAFMKKAVKTRKYRFFFWSSNVLTACLEKAAFAFFTAFQNI